MPEWRRTTQSNQLVANFRIASTARRYDRENRCWVDGNTLRIRVSAWRRLAEGVVSSISVGDPVVAYGRVYTRDWEDEEGNHRVAYEMEAHAIGHDLARGRARFARSRPTGVSTVEDAEADSMIGGETAEPVTDGPVGFGDGLPEPVPGEMEPDFLRVVAGLTETPEEPDDKEPPAEPEPEATTETRRSRRSRREPVAA
ncbi:single-stranded DNA-binding protein [Actinoplanes sp. HUAS TT8]|uniref:single-stranded DNA-binding protein n=1 Tax=Actinoplanes sp. HUAS TT8 TaxID=3447453 RepID=UPI003F5206E2